jgi:hypothetical protein
VVAKISTPKKNARATSPTMVLSFCRQNHCPRAPTVAPPLPLSLLTPSSFTWCATEGAELAAGRRERAGK